MNENIIAVNVPNAVSIVIMAVAGLFLLSLVMKHFGSGKTSGGGNARNASGG